MNQLLSDRLKPEDVISVTIGTELTAAFGADGTVTGSAGCNNYSPGYEVDGNP